MAKINNEAHEKLRLILEKQYGQPFALEEVREIGNELIDFYELLIRLGTENEDGIDTES
ncbi:MAG TPA: hypothetical protein VF733_03905 [Candidatus Saccharimonadales bacterium]